MAKNFRAQGQNLTVLATATVASGSFQVVEGVFGVALTDAVAGEEYTLRTGGVFDGLPKASADEPAQFAPAYWNGTAMTTAADDGGSPATDYLKVGVFAQAAADGDTTCEVRLNASF